MTFISPPFQTKRESRERQTFLTNEGGERQQIFTQVAPNEVKLEGKVVRAGHRLGGGVGG